MYHRYFRTVILQPVLLVVFYLLTVSASTQAAALVLPPELKASARVFTTTRDGLWEKSLIVQLNERRHLLSTSDGIISGLGAVNHAAHPLLWKKLSKELATSLQCGGKIYEQQRKGMIAGKLRLQPTDLTLVGTAADMDNLAVVTKQFSPFTVTALVTAGAKSNALRAGVDEGTNIEPSDPPSGTINIIVLTNARLTDGALARAVVTITEAKTAALEDLKVPSSYTKGAPATGTGTDSVIVVSGTSGPKVTYTGGHSRIGDLIAKAVHQAVIEALGKQNGFKLK
jgi:adenosylcobinamide amidohydrolase